MCPEPLAPCRPPVKIFVAGIATETNTFSPIPTALEDFHISRPGGAEAIISCGGITRIEEECAVKGYALTRSLLAFAEPSGKTVRRAYESLRDEILTDLRNAPKPDVVLLLLHGAMVADGYDDCEADLTAAVRAVVGPEITIGVELDLHAHLDERLLQVADLVLTYKEYPHTDIGDCAVELLGLCVAAARKEIRPRMALFDCRMIGLFSTLAEPMRSFVQSMRAAEGHYGLLSVSCCHGFPWGDVPHCGSKMLAIHDGDAAAAAAVATDFGHRLLALRHEIGFRSLTLDAALSQAVASPHRPAVVADQSDNAGGGAPADSTFALQWLLDHGVRNAGIAILYDPEVVKIALAAGVGALLAVRLGGKTSPASGNPLDLSVKVIGLQRAYTHEFPQGEGQQAIPVPMGDVVALETGGVYIIVSSRRGQCFSPKVFFDFGLDKLDIYIAKSTNHFRSGFTAIAGEIISMAAPGAVPPLMEQIAFRRVDVRNKYPWVADPFAG